MNSERPVRIFRRLRWTLLGLAFVLVYLFVFQRYVYQRVENESAAAMAGPMIVGDRHLIDTQPGDELLAEWIVAFWTDDRQLGWSRVRGVPGQILRKEGERWSIEVPGKTAQRFAPQVQFAAALDGHRLEPGQYLLLNDRLEAPFPDSRFLGLIDRKRILYRMVFHFGSGNG